MKKFLTNFCHPKQDHYQNQARNQAYKPIGQFINESRARDHHRYGEGSARAGTQQQFQYRGWNHPYSASGYYMKQDQNPSTARGNSNSKKISFKDFPKQICGPSGEGQQYQGGATGGGNSHYIGENSQLSFKKGNQCFGSNGNAYDQNEMYLPKGTNNKNDYDARNRRLLYTDGQTTGTNDDYNPAYRDRINNQRQGEYSRNYYSTYQQQQAEMLRRNYARERQPKPTRQAPYFASIHNNQHDDEDYDDYEYGAYSKHSRQNKKIKPNLHNSSYLSQFNELNNTVIVGQQNEKLKQENSRLKNMIEVQYKPLKGLYQKLIEEQQQRDFLISKLEWKVKELRKQAIGEVAEGTETGTGMRQRQDRINESKTGLGINTTQIHKEPPQLLQRQQSQTLINQSALNSQYYQQQPNNPSQNQNIISSSYNPQPSTISKNNTSSLMINNNTSSLNQYSPKAPISSPLQFNNTNRNNNNNYNQYAAQPTQSKQPSGNQYQPTYSSYSPQQQYKGNVGTSTNNLMASSSVYKGFNNYNVETGGNIGSGGNYKQYQPQQQSQSQYRQQPYY